MAADELVRRCNKQGPEAMRNHRYTRSHRASPLLWVKWLVELAELRVCQRLARRDRPSPDQVRKPTARPVLRWLFQCFEGSISITSSSPTGRS